MEVNTCQSCFCVICCINDYLNLFSKSLCFRSMLSFCLSDYLAVESEIIVRTVQTIGMKNVESVLNRVLLRTYSGQSMGNGTTAAQEMH